MINNNPIFVRVVDENGDALYVNISNVERIYRLDKPEKQSYVKFFNDEKLYSCLSEHNVYEFFTGCLYTFEATGMSEL